MHVRLFGAAFLFVPLFVVIATVSADPADVRQASRPNVIYVMADDLGIGDVKCYGASRCLVDTPHFDRLAREGMRFTDVHTIASVCVPSRIAIMTGRYPWRFRTPSRRGRWGYLVPRFSTQQFTLGVLLRAAGYRTGYVGKWHLGTRMQTTDGELQGSSNVDYGKPLLVGPPQFGFDESFILPGSLDMYPYAFIRNNRWLGQVTAQKGWSAFNRVGPAAEDFEDVDVLNTFSREAEQFIAKNAEAARSGVPFFLYLALTSPHTPVSPSKEFQGKSMIGPYGDFIMESDDCIGRVLQALEAHGIDDNTLVIATSDHGPASYAGLQRKAVAGQVRELEELGHHPSGPYRGYKFSAYEGGLRVPFVARWPRLISPGKTCDALVGLNDLMATVAEIAGVGLDDNQGPDSVSFLPLLKDAAVESPRSSLVLQSTRRFVVREGQWKLILAAGCGCSGRHGNARPEKEAWNQAVKLFGRDPSDADLRRAPFVQLYDLNSDSGEESNLASQYPERVERLIALLEKSVACGRSTPGESLKNDVDDVPIVFRPRA